ncbi:MAG: photosynthetic reaction center subunit H [Myxococcota bacterium]
MSNALTSYIDTAQVVLYAFWIFFFGLIIWLRREDRREGYPIESDVPLRVNLRTDARIPAPKQFVLPHGEGTRDAPNFKRDARAIEAERLVEVSGYPLDPVGEPLLAAVGPGSYAQRSDHPELSHEDDKPSILPMRVASQFSVSAGPDPRGWQVIGADGVVAGKVSDIWVDRADLLVRYLEVELDEAMRGDEALSEASPPPDEGKPDEGKPDESEPDEGEPASGGEGDADANESAASAESSASPDEGKPDEGEPASGGEGDADANESAASAESSASPDEGKPDEGEPDEGKPDEGEPDADASESAASAESSATDEEAEGAGEDDHEGADAEPTHPRTHTRLIPIQMLSLLPEDASIQVRALRSEQFAHVPTLKKPDEVTLLEEERVAAFYAGGWFYAEPDRREPLL